MNQFLAASRRGTAIFSTIAAIAILSGMSESGYAQDARTKARNTIRQCKANISRATSEISKLASRITAGDILIAINKVGLNKEMMKPNNEGKILALKITLAALEAARNTLVKNKQNWERYKISEQRSLATWEAYLRKLGG
jgi:hypothetical protein